MLARLVLALCFFACGVVSAAAPQCDIWRITRGFSHSGPAYVEGPDAGSACAATGAWITPSTSSSAYRISSGPTLSGTSCTFVEEVQTYNESTEEWGSWGPNATRFMSASINRQEDCPPDECEASAGNTGMLSGSGSSAPSTACEGGCGQVLKGISVAMGGTWAGRYESTGVSCEVPDELTQNVNCITTASGRVCASRQERNCGVFNGRQMCVDDIPEGICKVGEGGAICASGASGAPTDSEGAPATPDAGVKLGNGDGGSGSSFNYFSQTTINGSSTPVVGAGSGSDGLGGDDGDGDGEGGGVEECTSEADCYGTLPESFGECVGDLTGCVTSAASAAWGSLRENVPLLSLTANLHASLSSGGSCPSVSVTIFENDYDVMGPVCPLLEDNAGLLSLIFHICWSFMGLRILFGGE